MREALLKAWRHATARADRTVLVLAGALWLAGALMPRSAPLRFVHEDVRIRPHEARYTLAVSILRPRGEGPFGAIILNHGVPATAAARGAESPELFLHTASAVAPRGYAVFIPISRAGCPTSTARASSWPASRPAASHRFMRPPRGPTASRQYSRSPQAAAPT